MAKLRTDPIKLEDVENFLTENGDDFRFEIEAWNATTEACNIACNSHQYRRPEVDFGGFYQDPVTKRSRQYDLRIQFEKKVDSFTQMMKLAVECKNLRNFNPLLISRLPMRKEEKYGDRLRVELVGENKVRIDVESDAKMYWQEEWTGKSICQIGRKEHDGQFVENDEQSYDKWSQAIMSSYDLIQNVNTQVNTDRPEIRCFTIPILVIPNGMLWVVDYDNDGRQQGNPRQEKKALYSIQKEYQFACSYGGGYVKKLRLSHLHVYTLEGYSNFLAWALTQSWSDYFAT